MEAEQFIYTADSWPKGVYERGDEIFVMTLNGPVKITDHEWIVTGVQGERYPVKPDIFEMTFEAVD